MAEKEGKGDPGFKTEQKKTQAGPAGGGNKYDQATIKSDFFVVEQRPAGKFGKKADDSTAPRKS